MDENEVLRAGIADAGETAIQRPLVLLVLVLAASAVVVVASHGLRLLPPALRLDSAWTAGIRIAGSLAILAGSAGLVLQRRKILAEVGRKSDPVGVALKTAGTIMAALAVMALVVPPPSSPRDASDSGVAPAPEAGSHSQSGGAGTRHSQQQGLPLMGSGGSGGDGAEGNGATIIPGSAHPPGSDLLRRLTIVAFLLFLLFVTVVTYLTLTGRLGHRELVPQRGIRLTPPQAEASLEASLDEIAEVEGDPRDQITAAYLRLLRALAAAGARRRPQEAPHEFLRRVLGPLGVHPAPLHRLAALYVFSQFGRQPVTERHRRSAAEALGASLADLRSSDARSGAPLSAIPPEAPA